MEGEHYMSEKAKGKRRAHPIEIPTKEGNTSAVAQSSPTKPQERIFSVRFTDGSADMSITLGVDETVRNLKNIIIERRPHYHDKQLRLIFAGKMLSDSAILGKLLSVNKLEEETESHSRPSISGLLSRSLLSPQEKETPSSELASLTSSDIWLHCAISEKIEWKEISGVDQELTEEHPAGYERFLELGLSQSDIRTIRTVFQRTLFGANSNALSSYGLTPAEARRLESQWVDSLTQPSFFEEGTSNDVEHSWLRRILPSSTYSSSIRSTSHGLIFAFFFPLIAKFLLDIVYQPPAFFEGETWPGLNDERVEFELALELIGVKPHTDGAEGTSQEGSAETASAQGPEVVASPNSQPSAPTTTSDSPREQTDGQRSLSRVSDSIADPVPTIMFSDVMVHAVRAGLLLNFITGLYLWLYIL